MNIRYPLYEGVYRILTIIQGAIAEKQQGNITFILRIRDEKSRFNFF